MPGQHRALVVGDRFIPASVYVQILAEAASDAQLDLAIESLQLGYPAVDSVPLPDICDQTPLRPYWEDPVVARGRARHDRDGDDVIREYTGPVELLVPRMGDIDLLLVHLAPVSRPAIAAAPHLMAVGVARGGPTNVNRGDLDARAIPVFTCPARNAQAVAEFVLGAVLALIRGIAAGNQSIQASRWRYDLYTFDRVGFELHGKPLGLVGFGAVGRALAPIVRGFGMNLLVHDPYVDPGQLQAHGVESVTLDSLLRDAAIVVMAARLTNESRGLIGERELRLLRKDAILVNTARAELIDGVALRRALAERWFGGAVLDVYSPEPLLADDALLGMDHVLLTPHIAGASREAAVRGAEVVCRDLAAWLASEGETTGPGPGRPTTDGGR